VDIQHAELAVGRVAESVNDADRCRDVGAEADANDVVPHDELGFALEHVEGVDMFRVAVRVDSLEVRPEAQLHDLELGQLGEDAVMPVGARDLLAIVRTDEDAVHYMPIA